jgi:hypothetical protein
MLPSADAVLVIWSPGSDESEESLWTRLTTTLAQAAREILKDSQPQASASPKTAGPPLQEVSPHSDTVEIEYCTRAWSSVEKAVRRAMIQGAHKVVVVPIAFALNHPGPGDMPGSDLGVYLAQLESKYLEVEIVYVGPPFTPRQQLRRVFSTLYRDEPEKVDLLEDIVARGFAENWALFARFMQKLESVLPTGTRVGVRGSVVTGHSWTDGTPFDARGPGTSDLDLVLVGEEIMCEWRSDAFYIPEVNTMPLGDEMPDAAPRLNPVRVELQRMIGRPLHIQAMTEWYLDLRYYLLGQPYLFLDG